MSMWRPLFLKCMILDHKLQRMLNDSKIAQLNSERPLHQTAVWRAAQDVFTLQGDGHVLSLNQVPWFVGGADCETRYPLWFLTNILAGDRVVVDDEVAPNFRKHLSSRLEVFLLQLLVDRLAIFQVASIGLCREHNSGKFLAEVEHFPLCPVVGGEPWRLCQVDRTIQVKVLELRKSELSQIWKFYFFHFLQG